MQERRVGLGFLPDLMKDRLPFNRTSFIFDQNTVESQKEQKDILMT